MVAGTEGYENFTEHFIKSSQNLDFDEVCKDFVPFLPDLPANILDAGSGAGQNAAALACMGFLVTALEPISVFLDAAKETYRNQSIRWLNDSLPYMNSLCRESEQFEFVLIDGVWHHLDELERQHAVARLAKLITPGGKCAISLRNGPPGMGTRVYPTDSMLTIKQFEKAGFKCLLHLHNQPSIFSYKQKVRWARVVLQKC